MHSDRRQNQCCLCSCVQRGAREVHRFHTQWSWRARALSAVEQRSILSACEHVVRSDEELPPWRLPIKSSRRSPSMRLSTTTGHIVWSVVNGCLPSWPNFVSVHSLSLLPFSPVALKRRERKTGYLQDATQWRSQTNTCSGSRRGCAVFDYFNRRSKASGSNCSRDSTTTSA